MYLASTSRLYVAEFRHIDRLNIDSIVSLLNDSLAARVIMIQEDNYEPNLGYCVTFVLELIALKTLLG